MVEQSDAFKKAAECERLMRLQKDDVQRSAYKSLMEMWIGLANESLSMSPEEFVRQFEDLDQVQARFQSTEKR